MTSEPIRLRGTTVNRYPGIKNLKWRAQIKWKGKLYYLGLFKTQDEAHQAYLNMAKMFQERPAE